MILVKPLTLPICWKLSYALSYDGVSSTSIYHPRSKLVDKFFNDQTLSRVRVCARWLRNSEKHKHRVMWFCSWTWRYALNKLHKSEIRPNAMKSFSFVFSNLNKLSAARPTNSWGNLPRQKKPHYFYLCQFLKYSINLFRSM